MPRYKRKNVEPIIDEIKVNDEQTETIENAENTKEETFENETVIAY